MTISIAGEPTRQFSSADAAYAYWLEQLVADATPAVIIADSVRVANAVGWVKAPSVYKILAIHINHLAPPYSVDSSIGKGFGRMIANLERSDSMVFLTQEQLSDVQALFPKGRYSVIANLIAVVNDKSVERDKDLAVVVARLDPIKQIKNIINVFQKVLLRRPTARLEIWGEGKQAKELQEFIETKALRGSIALMGHAADVASVFKRASVSLAMSLSEGFGLSFAESLACGTPLVSLKTKYGPGEIVTSGEDGFLVDDENEFIEKVVTLLSDSNLVASMGVAGIRNMQRFSVENIGKLWLEHFDKLLALPPQDSYRIMAQ